MKYLIVLTLLVGSLSAMGQKDQEIIGKCGDTVREKSWVYEFDTVKQTVTIDTAAWVVLCPYMPFVRYLNHNKKPFSKSAFVKTADQMWAEQRSKGIRNVALYYNPDSTRGDTFPIQSRSYKLNKMYKP